MMTVLRSIALLLILGPVLQMARAYTMPPGLPDSWIDPDVTPPARPADWSAAVPGYYYVNNDTGTDSGRTYGTPSAPRATIPNPMPAGSYVEVHGTYDVSVGGSVTVRGSGTGDTWAANSAGPCWVVGIDGDKPTFTTSKMLLRGSYVYVYNVVSSGITSGAVVQVGSSSAGFDADHIAVLRCDISGTDTSGTGVAVAGHSTSPAGNVMIAYNSIHDHGPSYDIDQDSHMVNVASYASNVWILSNTLQNSAGSGMQFGPSSPGPQYVYVGNNSVNNSRQSGIWCKYGTDVIVSKNTVHDVKDRCVGVDTSPSKGMGAQYGPVRVWWLFNHVYNCRYGINVVSTDSSNSVGEYYAIGNLIRDCNIANSACYSYPNGTDSWGMCAIHLHGGSTRVLANNTISNCSSGIQISRAGANQAYVEGNIIDRVSHANGYFLFWEGTTSKLTFRNNLMYSPAGFPYNDNGVTYASLSAYQTAESNGTDCLESGPLFTNSATNDYTLQSGSPAIGAGILPAALATFFGYYGRSISTDISGASRPQNTTWDIGAYEFTSGGGGSSSATATTVNATTVNIAP